MHANVHISKISRSKGRSAVGAAAYRSAVACAAYRSGEKLEDKRYEKTYDYTNKENVLHSEIITPEHAPEWMKDRQKLWNGVEAKERRKDALLAKEALLVLPRDMTHEEHLEVTRSFIRDTMTSRDLVADFAIHSSDASDGLKNPHAHVMFTMRPVEGDSFGKKLTGMKDGLLDSKQFLQEVRQSYEDNLNEVSSRNGEDAFVYDLRSNKAKGIDREPQPKIGPKVTALEKRGYKTEWGAKCAKRFIKPHPNHHRRCSRTVRLSVGMLIAINW